MKKATFFIDLPNFYSRLLKSGIGEPRFLRDYFLYWLDFDLLAKSLIPAYSGIWVFYSGERIGPSSQRIEGTHLKQYIRRINALQGITAHDVNIPGEQREPSVYKCDKCGHQGTSEAVSEKGVDASLTVHLFDTMSSWDTAYLLSGDADFVPAVGSLRRKGKIIIGVGFSDASSALVRECYDYINIVDRYLYDDVALYSILHKDGVARNWLMSDLTIDADHPPAPNSTLELEVRWGMLSEEGKFGFVPVEPLSYYISLRAEGSIDLENRHRLVEEFRRKLSGQVMIQETESGYRFIISPNAWSHIGRRFDDFKSFITNPIIEDSVYLKFTSCIKKYQFNGETGRYEDVS